MSKKTKKLRSQAQDVQLDALISKYAAIVCVLTGLIALVMLAVPLIFGLQKDVDYYAYCIGIGVFCGFFAIREFREKRTKTKELETIKKDIGHVLGKGNLRGGELSEAQDPIDSGQLTQVPQKGALTQKDNHG